MGSEWGRPGIKSWLPYSLLRDPKLPDFRTSACSPVKEGKSGASWEGHQWHQVKPAMLPHSRRLLPSWSPHSETSPAWSPLSHHTLLLVAPSRAKSLVSSASSTSDPFLLLGKPLGCHTIPSGRSSAFLDSLLVHATWEHWVPEGRTLASLILTLTLRNLSPADPQAHGV